MNLAEVGREFGLLELAGGDVLVGLDHLAPGKQASDGLDGDIQPLRLATLFIALKLGEFRAQDRIAHIGKLLGRLAGADRLH